MYSPKELEGEVDHSFFDSDCEVGGTEVGRNIREGPEVVGPERKPSRTENHQSERGADEGGRSEVTDKQGETEEDVFAEETGGRRLEEDFSGLQVQISERQDRSKDAENGKEESSFWEGERTEREEERREGKDHSDLRNERKEGKFESDVMEQRLEAKDSEDSDASSRKSSPLPRSDRSESRRNSQSDDSSSVHSYSSVEPRSEDDDDIVVREEERPPEPQPPEHNPRFSVNLVGNKLAGKFRTQSQGCLSSSEHESSYSSDEKSPTLQQDPSVAPATPSPPQQPRQGSSNQRERRPDSESEDTVTDVTPLSTPDVSPKQSFDLTPPAKPSATVAGQQPQDVTDRVAVTRGDTGKRVSSDTDGEEKSVTLSSGRRLDDVLVSSSPGSTSTSTSGRRRRRRRRKNYSFTDEEVRRIERENQRLLRELSRTPPRVSPRTRNSGHAPSPTPAASGRRPVAPPPLRLYHTAINRQREQQRIQRENLAFLKRLESVKPTPGMTRSEQLTDYQRQAGYLGIPTSLIRPTSGRSSRSCSTNSPHRTRPETAKPSRTPPPRPAWN